MRSGRGLMAMQCFFFILYIAIVGNPAQIHHRFTQSGLAGCGMGVARSSAAACNRICLPLPFFFSSWFLALVKKKKFTSHFVLRVRMKTWQPRWWIAADPPWRIYTTVASWLATFSLRVPQPRNNNVYFVFILFIFRTLEDATNTMNTKINQIIIWREFDSHDMT